MATTTELARKFATFIQQRDPTITRVEILLHRQPSETLLFDRPDEPPPAPVATPEPVPAPVAEPEPEPPVKPGKAPRERRKYEHHLPGPDSGLKGTRYSPETIAQVKMLLERGMRPTEVARRFGMSQAHASNLKNGKCRRAVQAAPDPRSAQ